jgi:hypothetical protein
MRIQELKYLIQISPFVTFDFDPSKSAQEPSLETKPSHCFFLFFQFHF